MCVVCVGVYVCVQKKPARNLQRQSYSLCLCTCILSHNVTIQASEANGNTQGIQTKAEVYL